MSDFTAVTLPHSLEAEQAVLGAILVDQRCLNLMLERLRAEYFYNEQHQLIFEAMNRLFRTGQPVDIITVLNELVGEEVFSEEAGKSYLFTIAQNTPSINNAEAYAKIIREKYEMRALITAAREIIDDASDETNSPREVIDRAEQKIYQISDQRSTQGLMHIGDILMSAYDRLMLISQGDGEDLRGVPSGIETLDEAISGLNKSDLILLAARPGVGKTSFALNIAKNVALDSKKKVAFFSLEMTREQLALRLLSGESGVSSAKLRDGKLSPEEWANLTSSAGKLYNAPIYLDETGSITVTEMKAKLRRLGDVGLVVIDYLQLMQGSGGNVSRVQVVSDMTRGLKIMAKELNVPVLCLSQLNRGPESRAGHKPMLSDLRESGSIEQDADIVLFLYREAYYDSDGKEVEAEGVDKSKAKLIIAKNRHGETKELDLHWSGETTTFTAKPMR